jgi:hypothetical protein
MQKLRINKRENIVQDSGDILFKINLTLSRPIGENSEYLSIDYDIEFLNNGDIIDVKNISKEDYRFFMIPKIHKELYYNILEIDYLFQSKIII